MSNTLASGSAQTPPAGPAADPNAPPPGGDPNAPDPALDPSADPAGDPPAGDPNDPPDPPGRRDPENRIKEVVAERNATAEWGRHWFDVAQRLMQGDRSAAAPGGAPAGGAPTDPPAPATRPPPKLTDFPAGNGQFDAVKWSDELAKWNDEQLEVRTAAAIEKRLTARDAQAEQATAASTWQTRVAEVKKAEPNFEAIVGNPALPITKPMSAFIYRSELGPQLALHLAKNPAECARISLMPADKIPQALARLEGKLEAAAPAPGARPNGGAPPPRQQSRAPAPPSPNRGGAPASVNLETCSLDEYLAHRLPQMRR